MGLTQYDNIGDIFTAETIGAEITKSSVLRPITMTVLHHSATSASDYRGLETVKSFSRYHTSKSWKAIGYHWLIGPDGKIFAGRKMSEVGAHAGNSGNPRSIGVCLIGNLQGEDKVTQLQARAFAALHSALRKKYYGSGVSSLRFHRDFMNTNCPGQITREEVLGWIEDFERLGGTAAKPLVRYKGEEIGTGLVINGSTYVSIRDLERAGFRVTWTGNPHYTVDLE